MIWTRIHFVGNSTSLLMLNLCFIQDKQIELVGIALSIKNKIKTTLINTISLYKNINYNANLSRQRKKWPCKTGDSQRRFSAYEILYDRTIEVSQMGRRDSIFILHVDLSTLWFLRRTPHPPLYCV